MNLIDFRKQYPQYDDIPDEELANSLYSKFYSDIPREQFFSRILPKPSPEIVEAQQAATAGEEYWTGGKKPEPAKIAELPKVEEYQPPVTPEEQMVGAFTGRPSVTEALPAGAPVSQRPLEMPRLRTFDERTPSLIGLGAAAEEAVKRPAPAPTRAGPTLEAARQLEQQRLVQLANENIGDIEAARKEVARLYEEYPDLSQPKEQDILTYSALSSGARFIANMGDALYMAAEAGEKNIINPDLVDAVKPGIVTSLQNLAATLFPRDEEGKIKRLDLAERFDKKAKELAPSVLNRSFDDAWDSDQTATWLAAKIANSADSAGLLAATVLVPKLAPVTMPIFFASAAGGVYAEDRAAGRSVEQATLAAQVAGAAEVAFETLDVLMFRGAGKALGSLTRSMSAAEKEAFAASLVGRAVKGMAVTSAASLGSGLSESATSVVQDLSKKYISERDPGDMARNAKEAFIVGAAMGPVFSAIGAAPRITERMEEVNAERAAEQARTEALAKARTLVLPSAAAPASPPVSPQVRTIEQVQQEIQAAPDLDAAITTSSQLVDEVRPARPAARAEPSAEVPAAPVVEIPEPTAEQLLTQISGVVSGQVPQATKIEPEAVPAAPITTPAAPRIQVPPTGRIEPAPEVTPEATSRIQVPFTGRVEPTVTPLAPETAAPSAPETAPERAEIETPEPARQVILQNRNRATPASVAQMTSIAAKPDYGRLGFSRDFANGAPVVFGGEIPQTQLGNTDTTTAQDGRKINIQYAVIDADKILASNRSDGTVNQAYGDLNIKGTRAVAGNGRIAGLQTAYENKKAGPYRKDLADDALHGIDKNVIRKMKRPVLVRVMSEQDVTPDIGDVSNVGAGLALSSVEQAKNDANRINLEDLTFTADGRPNNKTVTEFVRSMPASEQGALIDTNGIPTAQAVDRLNAAIFSGAYKNDELVRLYAQAQDPEAKLVLSALAQVAPKMVRLEGAGDLDFRDAVTSAAEAIVNGKRQGLTLDEIARQRDITVSDPAVGEILNLFSRNPRSAKTIVRSLGRAADIAYQEANKPSEDMFGAAPKLSRADIVGNLEEFESDQGELYNIEGERRAIQKPSPEAVSVLPRTGGGEEVGQRDTEGQEVTGEGGARKAGSEEVGVEQTKAYTDPYENIETRPNTTERQRTVGRDALAALARRIRDVDAAGRASGDIRGAGSILGNRLIAGFEAAGGNQLVGQVVESPADLAILAQVYRDPRFETFRVIYTKKNLVVGEAGYTSRLPAVVFLPKDFAARISNDKNRFDADGFFIMHNHPSGKAEPSGSDISLTKYVASQITGFREHIVIDSNEYGVIGARGNFRVFQAPEFQSRDFTKEPSVPHAILGKVIKSVASVVEIAKDLQTPNTRATLILSRRQGEVQLIVDVPLSALKDQSPRGIVKGKALIRRMARDTGSGGKRVIVLPEGLDVNDFSSWVRDGVFADVVDASGQSYISQKKRRGIKPDFLDTRQSMAARDGGAEEVAEARPSVVNWAKKEFGDRVAPNGNPVWQNFVRWARNAPMVTARNALSYDFKTGQPFVAESFHGTNAEEDFEVFDAAKGGEQTFADSARQGFFSTSETEVATGYATNIGAGRVFTMMLNGAPDFIRNDPEAIRLDEEKRRANEEVSKAYDNWYQGVTDNINKRFAKTAKQGEEPTVFTYEQGKRIAVGLGWENKNEPLFPPGAIDKIENAILARDEADSALSKYISDRVVETIPSRIIPLYVRMENPMVFDAEGKTPADFPLSERIAKAKEDGHDGVVFKNIADPSPVAVHYVTFNDNDLKSAVGNNGNFSTEPSIVAEPKLPYEAGSPTVRYNVNDPTRADDIIRVMQDRGIDMKRVIQKVRASGTQVKETFDPYLQEGLYVSRVAAKDDLFRDTEWLPLLKDIGARNLTREDVEQYLHARHAPSRNKEMAKRNPTRAELDAKIQEIRDALRNAPAQQADALRRELSAWEAVEPFRGTEEERQSLSGMSAQAAMDYMNSLSPEKRNDLEAVAAKVDAIIAKTRQMLIDGGVDSKDSFNDNFEYYVPLYREGHEEAGGGYGQGYSVRGKTTKTATGSTRNVVDILASIAAARALAVTRVEKNRIANAMLGLAITAPDASLWAVDKVPKVPTLDKATGKVVMRGNPNYGNRDNVIVARVPDGKGNIVERAVVFNENSARAMAIAAYMKKLDADQLGAFEARLAAVTRFIASMNTQYNPIFGVVNLLRDVQGAAVNLSDTPLAGKQVELVKTSTKMLSEIWLELRAQRRGETRDTEYSRLFEEFKAEGGQTGFRSVWGSREEATREIEKAIKRVGAKGATGAFYKTSDALAAITKHALSDYNQTLENTIRLAAYKMAKDSGMSKAESAMLAKDITVNFNRKGTVSTKAGAYYAFFNAAVQGTARLGRVLDIKFNEKGYPTVGKRGIKIIAGGVSIGMLQAMMLAAAGFDEDEPPQFVKEKNFIIPFAFFDKFIDVNKLGLDAETMKNKYITIPMPLGLNVLPNLGRISTELVLSGFKDPVKKAGEMIKVSIDAFNPLGSSTLAQTIAPTTLDPFVALYENKDWTGKPIYRESLDKFEAKPGFERAKDNASYFGLMVAKGLNRLSGGTDYTSGLFPSVLSPTSDQIDYLVGQALGGVGRELTKVQKTISAQVTGEELPPYQIPLLSRFYGEVRNKAAEGQKFYDNVKELLKHQREVTGMAEEIRRREEEGQDAEKIRDDLDAYIEKNPQYELAPSARSIMREVQQIRARKREAMKAGADKEEIKEFEEAITQRMSEFNAVVKEFGK